MRDYVSEAFKYEFEKQIHCYDKYKVVQSTGFDNGYWYGGFLSLFYRMKKVIAFSHDMPPRGEDRIPFLLVLGETTIPVPRMLELMSGVDWNRKGKPSVPDRGFGLPYRAWLAVDVQFHKYDIYAKRRRLSPSNPAYVGDDYDARVAAAIVHEEPMWAPSRSEYDMSDSDLAEELQSQGRTHATVCDGMAAAVVCPDILKRHYAFGLYGSQVESYSAPFIHSRPNEAYDDLPQDKPALLSHSVGKRTFGGPCAIMTVGGVIPFRDR